MPTPNDRPSIQSLVRDDLEMREILGTQRYGTPLQAYNGRDGLRDLYEELLDGACYARQLMEERGAVHPPHPTCRETTSHVDLVEGRRTWVCGLGCPGTIRPMTPRMTQPPDLSDVGLYEQDKNMRGARLLVRCLVILGASAVLILLLSMVSLGGHGANRSGPVGTDTPGRVLPSPYGYPSVNPVPTR